ncbi:restriction endonuclease subunit S [Streptomyces sp. NBC_01506]|uniref:restriction endonuclease subunit S n=1 Tax=Streptomyces sp. NBC_01506 TaxID=2903887 RepID=UPI003867A108
MTPWQVCKLSDLCEIISGPSGQQLEELSAETDGIPVISPPDLTAENAVDARSIRRVGPDVAAGLARFQLQDGDLIYVRQGALGRRAVVGPAEATWLFGAACLRVRPQSGAILPKYLLHYLGHPVVHEWITSQANRGYAVDTVTSRTVASTPVFVPDLARQRAVTGAMEEVGTQIQTHRRLIAKLEAIRPSLLTDLLGDAFDGLAAG